MAWRRVGFWNGADERKRDEIAQGTFHSSVEQNYL